MAKNGALCPITASVWNPRGPICPLTLDVIIRSRQLYHSPRDQGREAVYVTDAQTDKQPMKMGLNFPSLEERGLGKAGYFPR